MVPMKIAMANRAAVPGSGTADLFTVLQFLEVPIAPPPR
jgi:hypothetical protein